MALFDQLAERYDSWFEGAGKAIFGLEVQAIRKLTVDLPRPWFEIGVGSGRFAEALGIPWGIDPSKKLGDMARDRGIKVIEGKGEALPLPDNLLGSVFLFVTLCFVDDPDKVIAEVARVLKDGGFLVVGIVPAEFPWGRYYQELGRKKHPFYSHARFIDCRNVISLLKKHGFHVENKLSTLFSPPGKELSPEVLSGYQPDAGLVALSTQFVKK